MERTELDTSIINPPWEWSTFTDEQKALLQKFKEGPAKEHIKEGSYLSIDIDLMRWLVARKWDVDAATEMFIESMKWREKHGADTILEDYPKSPYFPLLQQYWPDSVMNQSPKKPAAFRTKDGFQLYVDRFSSIDTSLLNYFPREELYRHRIWVQETRAKERIDIYKETGRYAGLTSISDLSCVGFSHLTGNVLTQVQDSTKMDSANYPETMRKAYIINTPSFFNSLWSVVSYLWDEDQKKKMKFAGTSKSSYEEIFEICDKSMIPVELGGTSEWELPTGGSISSYKLDFPVDTRDWKKVTVGRSSIHTEVLHIPTVDGDHHLHWEFKTKSYDIEFGIYHTESLNIKFTSSHSVIEQTKVDSHVFTVSGKHKVEKPGYYHIVWDNYKSWTRSKDLEFILHFPGSHENIKEKK